MFPIARSAFDPAEIDNFTAKRLRRCRPPRRHQSGTHGTRRLLEKSGRLCTDSLHRREKSALVQLHPAGWSARPRSGTVASRRVRQCAAPVMGHRLL